MFCKSKVRAGLAAASWLFVLCLFPSLALSQAATAPRNVIINSWDGLDRLVLWELLAKQKLPNLAAIIREGSLQEIEVKGHKTETKPSHAEMLTGLGVEDTGVVSNEVFQPIPEGYSIFERLQTHLGGKQQVRTFMVTGGVAHVGGRGPEEVRKWMEEKRDRELLKKYGRALPKGVDDVGDQKEYHAEPFFITRRALDAFDADRRDVSVTGTRFLEYLERFHSPRFVALLHFSDTDHAGHLFGSDSDEYRDAAMECDKWLGRVVEWLKKEGLYDQTLIYVMADHGFDPHSTKHSNAPHSWLATNDPLVTHGGIIADVPATILTRFGVDPEKLQPRLIGKPLTGPFEKNVHAFEADKSLAERAQRKEHGSWFSSTFQKLLRHLKGTKDREGARSGWPSPVGELGVA